VILRQAKRWVGHELALVGIEDAPAEADLLVGYALRISKTQLYTEFDRTLTPQEIELLQEVIRRRAGHEPVAYIMKRWEFYGIDFYIDQRVLIPRPETELLVEEAIVCASRCFRKSDITIADVGTGSGIIAINLAMALPRARIYATDISNPALQVARINCQRHKVSGRVELLQGNLLEPLPGPVDMLVANLPYIRDSELKQLSPEIVDFEPGVALDGGEDGLDEVRALMPQVPVKVHPGGSVLLEVGLGQAETVASLMKDRFPGSSVASSRDLGGIDRVVKTVLCGGSK